MPGIVKELANPAEMPRLNSPAGTEVVPAMTALGGAVAIPVSALGGGGAGGPRTIIDFNTSRTLAATDAFSALHQTGSSDVTVTVPNDATVNFTLGTEIEVLREGSGGVTIQGAPGVSINGTLAGSVSISSQWGSAVLRRYDANTWVVVGQVGNDALPVYTWTDVFADHSAAGGADWTGWGATAAQPGNIPLEWFLNNIIPAEAPDGAIVDLTTASGGSPGTFHMKGRLQPMPTSLARNVTVNMTGTVIPRTLDTDKDRWGQWFIWGEKVQDSALSNEAIIGADSYEGDTILYLRNPDTETDELLAAATVGTILEIRTNTTGPNYHPDESRTTVFVQSVDDVNKTITIQSPLEIDVPEDNPVDPWDGSSDPSTLTMLLGGQLTASVPAGATTLTIGNPIGLVAGDWILVATTETPGRDSGGNGLNQFTNNSPDQYQTGDDLDITFPADYGGAPVLVNQELHQITSVSGNTITLKTGLGKNKLTTWGAYIFKVDPVENFTLIGGNFRGDQNNGGASAWDHQYIWTRYMVNSTIKDCFFDDDPALGLALRRTGQAVRFDAGDNNVMDNLWIGQPSTVDAGEGYGVSFRYGERNSVIRNSYTEFCRHSIEFWASSGGCTAEDTHTHNTTSSSIDTHGNWNTGVIIRRNLVTRDRTEAGLSGDLDGEPDAIRIGNNKFMFDENILVTDNQIINFDGNALSVVPGCWDVSILNTEIRNVYRILNFKNNTRHKNLFVKDVLIDQLDADDITDRLMDIRHNASETGQNFMCDSLVLSNWRVGHLGQTTLADNSYVADPSGFQIVNAKNITLRDWDVRNMTVGNATDEQWCFVLQESTGIEFDNVVVDCLPGASGGFAGKGIRVVNAQNVIGDIKITGLDYRPASGTPMLLQYADGGGAPFNSSTGPEGLTIYHDLGGSPNINGTPESGWTPTLAAA